MTRATRTGQAGFTLVELLISIAIGLAITTVIANLFLSSRRTYAATEDVGRMQDNMRFAYQLMSRTVHLAGFKSAPNAVSSVVFAAPTAALAGTEGAGTAPDSLTVRYQGSSDGATAAADGSVVDCTGQEIAGGVMATNTFTIATGASGTSSLFCNGVEVVPDVLNMQLLYGEDTNADMVADHYVSLSGVANFDNVVNVRMALLFQTPTIQAAATTDTRTYDLNGTLAGPFNDGRVKRVLTLNVNLRNRTP